MPPQSPHFSPAPLQVIYVWDPVRQSYMIAQVVELPHAPVPAAMPVQPVPPQQVVPPIPIQTPPHHLPQHPMQPYAGHPYQQNYGPAPRPPEQPPQISTFFWTRPKR